jgi:hypothetical protein
VNTTVKHWARGQRQPREPGAACVSVPEIARVLRDGGRLGVIWTSRDRGVDWVAELDMLRRSPAAEPQPRRRREITLPEGAPFENFASASFTFARTMTVDDAVDWMATYSRVITESPAERAAALARVREVLLRQADGAEMIEIPMRSRCWRADRVQRSAPTSAVTS